jgi:5'-3' exonuclease
MDKILLIDGHANIWRSCVTFGPPKPHLLCVDNLCAHLKSGVRLADKHCTCQSPWDEFDSRCYGDKYSFVFNFFRNLRPLIEDFAPDKCFFVLEGRPQFRYDLFSDYKANRIIKQASRQDANDKFMYARDIILSLIKHLPITLARAANYEADDTIATLCENMKDEDLTVLSNDSDFIQLLQRDYSNLRVYSPIKKVDMEAPPYPYVAWKCLAGDKSDNIPSLVKPKKALEMSTNPELFKTWMEVEENRANFSINRQLIEFKSVPEEEIFLIDGQRNFILLKEEFSKMKFESIINDTSWNKYVKTFDTIKY